MSELDLLYTPNNLNPGKQGVFKMADMTTDSAEVYEAPQLRTLGSIEEWTLGSVIGITIILP